MPGLNEEKNDDFDLDAAVRDLGEELFGTTTEDNSDADTPDDAGDAAGSVPAVHAPADGAGATDVVADKAAAEKPADDGQGDPPAPDSVAPPKTWRSEAAGMWAQLPPAVQQEVLKREADIFQGIEQYRDLAQTGRAFQQTLAPFI